MNAQKPDKYHFFVDNKKYDTDRSSLTGQEIKAAASVPADYQLFLEQVGNAPDQAVSDTTTIVLENPPKHFYAVPPATFGR